MPRARKRIRQLLDRVLRNEMLQPDLEMLFRELHTRTHYTHPDLPAVLWRAASQGMVVAVVQFLVDTACICAGARRRILFSTTFESQIMFMAESGFQNLPLSLQPSCLEVLVAHGSLVCLPSVLAVDANAILQSTLTSHPPTTLRRCWNNYQSRMSLIQYMEHGGLCEQSISRLRVPLIVACQFPLEWRRLVSLMAGWSLELKELEAMLRCGGRFSSDASCQVVMQQLLCVHAHKLVSFEDPRALDEVVTGPLRALSMNGGPVWWHCMRAVAEHGLCPSAWEVFDAYVPSLPTGSVLQACWAVLCSLHKVVERGRHATPLLQQWAAHIVVHGLVNNNHVVRQSSQQLVSTLPSTALAQLCSAQVLKQLMAPDVSGENQRTVCSILHALCRHEACQLEAHLPSAIMKSGFLQLPDGMHLGVKLALRYIPRMHEFSTGKEVVLDLLRAFLLFVQRFPLHSPASGPPLAGISRLIRQCPGTCSIETCDKYTFQLHLFLFQQEGRLHGSMLQKMLHCDCNPARLSSIDSEDFAALVQFAYEGTLPVPVKDSVFEAAGFLLLPNLQLKWAELQQGQSHEPRKTSLLPLLSHCLTPHVRTHLLRAELHACATLVTTVKGQTLPHELQDRVTELMSHHADMVAPPAPYADETALAT